MLLFFMRHAETEINPIKNDIDRELTQTGIIQAKGAAKFLSKYQIDKMIVSYAKRTMQTADILQETISVNDKEIISQLYEGNEDDIIDLLLLQNNKRKNILIVGHNPTIFLTTLKLMEQNSSDYDTVSQSIMHPAKIIVLEFVGIQNWQELDFTKGNLVKTSTT
ncbi:MAG: hypothetical protein EKK61_01950 [Rickettsiales bacterium]|nr:MAG: hypothetical protein EKK61_01950 [Rickettsiales bacterium]